MLFNKPILVDCDGVLCDFTQAVLDMQVDGNLKREDITDWDLFDLLEDTDAANARTVLTHSASAWENMGLIEGAEYFFGQLRGLGKANGRDVLVVSSPWQSNPNWDRSRKWWLNKHFDVKPENVIITPHKHLLDGFCLIDDKLDNVNKYALIGRDNPIWFKENRFREQEPERLVMTANSLPLVADLLGDLLKEEAHA